MSGARAAGAVLALAAGAALALSAPALAAKGKVVADWEPKSPTSFTSFECPHLKRQFALVSSPVREGSRAARFSVTPADVWQNGSVRCLAVDYTSGETTGMDEEFHLSVYFPKRIENNLIWELHHPVSLYKLAGCGVAPLALHTQGSGLLFRIATGDCRIGKKWSFWSPNIVIPGLSPYPTNTWIDIKIHIRFSESANGLVEIWHRRGGGSWPSSPQLTRKNVPTMPFSSTTGVRNVKLYTTMGLYPSAPYTGNDTIYLDDYRRTTRSTGVLTRHVLLAVGVASALLVLALAIVGRLSLRPA